MEEAPVAVVTGGGRGIGVGISRALAESGFNIVIGWTSDESSAAQVAKNIVEDYGVRVVLCGGDVSVPETSATIARLALDEFGRLDCWVNNAGYLAIGSIQELVAEQMLRCYEINVLGTLYGIQSAEKAMTHGGRIINIASEAGIRAWPLYGAYAPSKFGQIGLTQVAALELGSAGITVNSICPGMIETDMVAAKWDSESAISGRSIDEIRAEVTAETLTGQLCKPEDVGSAVAWLASPGAKNITGQAICVNSGVTLH